MKGLWFVVPVLVALCVLAFKTTQGFRTHLILSNLPNDPRWETPPPDAATLSLLSQEFTFLGRGGWCFAFLGADGKTVLKFYRHDHLTLPKIWRDFSWDKLFLHSSRLPSNASYFQEFNFKSCMLLYNQAKAASGLLYVHLNKTKNHLAPVTLIDASGVRHTIDLDSTEFVLQKKGDLLIPYLQTLMDVGDLPAASQALSNLISSFCTLYAQGIQDLDTSFRNNYGFCEEEFLILDISSFAQDPTVQDPATHATLLRKKTQRLARWLKKNHPTLHTHYERLIHEI